MAGPVIEGTGLTKRYGSFTAVNGLNLRIQAGEVFGLLGPNGSGKTTTILMILGLTEPTAGQIRVLGLDPLREPLAVKRRVGYLPDAIGFYDAMTARQNLRYTARLAGLDDAEIEQRIDSALARVNLSDKGDNRVGTYSRGMRQRLGLADVLLKGPGVVILDEPTTGLDPQSTREFLSMIRTLKADGMTILLSSHLLGQVQAVCDRVGLFYQGRMVLEGTVKGIAAQTLGGAYCIDVEAHGPKIAQVLARVPKVAEVETMSEGRYRLRAEADIRRDLMGLLSAQGIDLLGLSLSEFSLDDVYNHYFTEVEHAAA